MALEFNLRFDPEPRTTELAPPLNDTLLTALLELAESAERNQARDGREQQGEDGAAVRE